jgi:hypothetical protein
MMFPGRPQITRKAKLVSSVVTPVIPTPGNTASWFFPLGPGGYTPGPTLTLWVGQSNALLFNDAYDAPLVNGARFNSVSRFFNNFQAITKIPGANIQSAAGRSDFSDPDGSASLFAGTSLYTFAATGGDPKWLEPVGNNLADPSTWANNPNMVRWLKFVTEKQATIAADRPIMIMFMWDEYMSKFSKAEADVFRLAMLEFMKRTRAVCGSRGKNLVPFFFVNVAYGSGTNTYAMRMIRDSWMSIAKDATNHAYIMHGGTGDQSNRDGDGGSHFTVQSADLMARRMAVHHARWYYDNGLVPATAGDLTWLPHLGPTIVDLERVSGSPNKLRGTVLFDGVADDLVAPTGQVDLGQYLFTENDAPITLNTITRFAANKLEFTFASNIGANSIVKLDFSPRNDFNGLSTQWTDNFHLKQKTAAFTAIADMADVRFILNRFGGVVTLGSSNAPTGGTGGSTPIPGDTGGSTGGSTGGTGGVIPAPPLPATSLVSGTDGVEDIFVPDSQYFRIDGFDTNTDKLKLPYGTDPATVTIDSGHDDQDGAAWGMLVNYGSAGLKVFARYNYNMGMGNIIYDTTAPVVVADPNTQTFSISPNDPGTRAAGPQTLTITSTNIPSMSWTRIGGAPDYAFLGGDLNDGKWTDVPTTGSINISPNWTATGQMVKYWPTGQITRYKDTLPVTVTASAPVSAAPGTDRAFAHDFVKDLRMGVNLERDNTDFVTDAWIDDLIAADVSHIRLYPYSNATLGFKTNAQLQGHIDAINRIMARSPTMKVLFELQDVSSIGDLNNAGTLPYLQRCCDLINAQNWAPTRFAIGHTNEMANAGNTTFNTVNNYLLDQMRARLKDTTILIQSCGNWGSPDTLTDGTLVIGADKRRVFTWHHYEWDHSNSAAWKAKYDAVKAWATTNAVEFMNAEFNKYDPNFADTQYSLYPAIIDAYAKGAKGGGTIWTFTRGSGWRLNVAGGANGSPIAAASTFMRPEVKTAITSANAWIRAQAGFGT